MGSAAAKETLHNHVDVCQNVDREAERISIIVDELAQKVLRPEDWQVLDAAFAENRDPLTGHKPSAEYEQLFSRIVRTAPAPIGLGGAA